MSDTQSNQQLQQLEERHVQLIDELDALNQRLEETLNSFAKPSKTEAPEV